MLSPIRAEPIDLTFQWGAAPGPVVGYDVHATISGAWVSQGTTATTQFTFPVERGEPVRVRVFGFDASGVPGPMSELSPVYVAGDGGGIPVGQPGTIFFVPETP
jgi:hypothetical protein